MCMNLVSKWTLTFGSFDLEWTWLLPTQTSVQSVNCNTCAKYSDGFSLYTLDIWQRNERLKWSTTGEYAGKCFVLLMSGNVYPLIVTQWLQNTCKSLSQLLIYRNYKLISFGCTGLWNLTCTHQLSDENVAQIFEIVICVWHPSAKIMKLLVLLEYQICCLPFRKLHVCVQGTFASLKQVKL